MTGVQTCALPISWPVVCNRCPVTSQCLAWALETGQDAGVWGGMSEDERRALKRRRNRGRTRRTARTTV